MSRTKKLSPYQFIWEFELNVGGFGEINLCKDCNGKGAIMSNDRLESVKKCERCNFTGRIKNE